MSFAQPGKRYQAAESRAVDRYPAVFRSRDLVVARGSLLRPLNAVLMPGNKVNERHQK